MTPDYCPRRLYKICALNASQVGSEGFCLGRAGGRKAKGRRLSFWGLGLELPRGGGVCSNRMRGLYSEWATKSCKVPEQGCDVRNIWLIAPWSWEERKPQRGEINLKTRRAEGAAPARNMEGKSLSDLDFEISKNAPLNSRI